MLIEWVAFILTVVFATVLRWEAKDLIWGLWISSLCVGYAYILRVIFAGVARRPAELPLPVAIFGAVFLLAFFTFHFGMFHFVHSVFLSLFFPIIPRAQGSMPDFPLLVVTAFKLYWPVVAANLLVKLPDFTGLITDMKQGKDFFAKPYASVIKIHILIFVFAAMSALHIDRFAIYPILVFFFFPMNAVFQKK